MSDYIELVKRLRHATVAQTIGQTKAVVLDDFEVIAAANAIEERAATIACLQSEIGNYELANEGQFHDIARLSARLEAEVRARHQFMGWQQGWCPTSIGAACACEWTGRVPVGAHSETEAEAEHAAHVNEAVAEALGAGP